MISNDLDLNAKKCKTTACWKMLEASKGQTACRSCA